MRVGRHLSSLISLSSLMFSCWIEVNRDALRANFRGLQTLVGPDVALIAVVKANAFGLGAIEVSRVLTQEGAPMLAVTRVEEALPLREAGISIAILLLTPALPDECEAVVTHDLTATVTSFEDALSLSETAAKLNLTAHAQLKINTGMGRLGVEASDAVALAQRIQTLPNLQLETAWTHFARALEADDKPVRAQWAQFQSVTQRLERECGMSGRGFHCANSAALLRFPAMRLHCVRPGTLLYGQFPSPEAKVAGQKDGLTLRDPFSARARIISIREVKAGQTIGYGGEWTAKRASRIATLPIGYADGLSQEPQARVETPSLILSRAARRLVANLKGANRTVSIGPRKLPIIGRIAMQQCSIDITDAPDVKLGDVATLFVRRTSAGAHLPRVYVDDAAEK